MEILKKSHILFVDDEYHVLDGLRRMLSKYRNEFNVVFAASVNEALKVIGEGDFDTVVSDITMPERDGFDLLQTLRENSDTRDLPVVVLTGLSDREVKKRALELGATDILNKPVDQEELIARLRSCVRQKRYLDEIKKLNNNLQLKVKERTLDLAQSRLDMILRLGYLAEYREQVSGTHGIKVGCYAKVIGETLELDALFLERIFVASPLHDVGKIGISDKVLNKKGPLTFDEWALLKEHCIFGWEILNRKIPGISLLYSMEGHHLMEDLDPQKNPLLKLAATIALTHHEWWNGKGYPHKLSGEDIPLESRIVALADVYDELTTERPYESAHSEEEALALIRQKSGEQFDPKIHTAFENSIPKIREIQKLISQKDSREKNSS